MPTIEQQGGIWYVVRSTDAWSTPEFRDDYYPVLRVVERGRIGGTPEAQERVAYQGTDQGEIAWHNADGSRAYITGAQAARSQTYTIRRPPRKRGYRTVFQFGEWRYV